MVFVYLSAKMKNGTGPFMSGRLTRTKAHMTGGARSSWPRQHSPNRAPQAPSNKLCPAEVG